MSYYIKKWEEKRKLEEGKGSGKSVGSVGNEANTNESESSPHESDSFLDEKKIEAERVRSGSLENSQSEIILDEIDRKGFLSFFWKNFGK